MKKIKAFGYARVSTLRQAEQGLSLDSQREQIQRFVGQHQWELAGQFSDKCSGKTARRRDGLHAAIEAACESKGVLVIYSLSRFARSVVDTYGIAQKLQAAEASLASVTEPVDTTTAMGKAFFGLLAVFAQLESDQIGERVKASNVHVKRRLGYRTQGVQPAGWKIVNGVRVPNEEERKVVQQVLNAKDEGGTYRAAAKLLNDAGVRTVAMMRGKTKRQTPNWSAPVVRKIVVREEEARKKAKG